MRSKKFHFRSCLALKRFWPTIRTTSSRTKKGVEQQVTDRQPVLTPWNLRLTSMSEVLQRLGHFKIPFVPDESRVQEDHRHDREVEGRTLRHRLTERGSPVPFEPSSGGVHAHAAHLKGTPSFLGMVCRLAVLKLLGLLPFQPCLRRWQMPRDFWHRHVRDRWGGGSCQARACPMWALSSASVRPSLKTPTAQYSRTDSHHTTSYADRPESRECSHDAVEEPQARKKRPAEMWLHQTCGSAMLDPSPRSDDAAENHCGICTSMVEAITQGRAVRPQTQDRKLAWAKRLSTGCAVCRASCSHLVIWFLGNRCTGVSRGARASLVVNVYANVYLYTCSCTCTRTCVRANAVHVSL